MTRPKVTPSVLIEARKVVGGYGSRAALTDFNVELGPGEVLGLLGHNGAGKTTAIRLFNGVLRPAEGTVRVFGLDPVVDGSRVRARVGVVLEDPGVDGRQTARGHLAFFAQVYRMPADRAARRIAEVLELFGLADRADERVAGFSRGMRQRLALCRALLHEPDILYLDEPTAGLDPVATIQLRELIAGIRRRGAVIVLASHDLSEVAQLCDQVVILRDGRIVAEGAPAELAERWVRNISVDFEVAHGMASRAGEIITKVPMVHDIQCTGADRLTCTVEHRDAIPRTVRELALADLPVFGVVTEVPTLETMYLGLHEQGALHEEAQ